MTARPASGCYVSPFPTAIQPTYRRRRADGQPSMERVHLLPMRGGGIEACNPRLCRECEREQSWHDHGEPV